MESSCGNWTARLLEAAECFELGIAQKYTVLEPVYLTNHLNDGNIFSRQN